MSYTKGPWEVKQYENRQGEISILIASGPHSIVAVINQGFVRPPVKEVYANANLIAAAPELLVTLKELADASVESKYGYPPHDRIVQALMDAKEAIAKAEGDHEK